MSVAHVSFSILGLFAISFCGGLLVLISILIEPITFRLRRRWRLNDYTHLEWCTNQTFQLQRLAHEGIGVGIWTGATEDVPTTVTWSEPLAMLDLTDRKHPKLREPDGVMIGVGGSIPSDEVHLRDLEDEGRWSMHIGHARCSEEHCSEPCQYDP
jgi:hypothetical protein